MSRVNSAISPLQIEGFVLAGGRSTRFESNKALALWEGKPLLTHALKAIAGLGMTPRVVARDFLPLKDMASAFVLSESPDLGPAEGLRAALASSSREWNLLLSTDMPGVNTDTLQTLLDSAGDSLLVSGTAPVSPSAICFKDSGGRSHPFPGLYHRSLLGILESQGPGGSMQGILDQVQAKRVEVEGPAATNFLWNINRPQDLKSRTS